MKLLLILLMVTSCGKGEIVGDAVDVVVDMVQDAGAATLKAIDDVYREGDRTSNKVITDANDVKNEILSNTGNLSEDLGDAAESIAQAPKKIARGVLGIEDDKDDIKDLQDADKALQAQLDQLKSEIAGGLSELSDEISEVSSRVSENKQQFIDEMIQMQVEIYAAIQSGDKKNKKALKKLKKKVKGLKEDLETLEESEDDLDIICRTYVYKHRSHYHAYTACNVTEGPQ